MAFDFKKAYPEYYLPKQAPGIVEVPPMRYAAVRGQGDPNEPGGAYQQAINVLYAVSYTLRMSARAGRAIEGYFEYVVPPLEGFWRQAGEGPIDFLRKDDFEWIACIRLPDFVTPSDFEWAREAAGRKKGLDCSMAEYLEADEGLCAQVMHVGPYDDEPRMIAQMEAFIAESGFESDFSNARRHHEIYLSDPRRTAPDKLRTVIRQPIRKLQA